MSIIGLVGAGLTFAGLADKEAAELQKQYFAGAFEVTAGDSVEGIYGSHYAATFGPSISHNVDLKFGGLYGIDISDTSLVAFLSVLLGLGGNVDVVYGQRTTATYGTLLDIQRGPTITKRGNTATVKQLWSGNMGAAPANVAADEVAAGDAKTLRMVTLLSLLNNLTIATTQLFMHFKYQDYHRPRPEHEQAGGADKYDHSSWNEPPRVLDAVVTQLPKRLMAIIALIERAGGLESGWMQFKDSGWALGKKVGEPLTIFLSCTVGAGLSAAAFGVGAALAAAGLAAVAAIAAASLAVGAAAAGVAAAGGAVAVVLYGLNWLRKKAWEVLVNMAIWIKDNIGLFILILGGAATIAVAATELAGKLRKR